ncbi:N-acetyl-beta-D-mannosaminyl-1,4-N-acetyl-D- glucosaminyldiphosphoundecaprenyl glycerophosphotransferase [Planococcus halocryophilus Or1]|nr:N-acetyl-beta-D-mannosaminyl-1,4-N-acetyl-D- glucosaminyldiphosphoundecaprenyl glycerophosphotransferase [Planococcus halocryophilus Or1]
MIKEFGISIYLFLFKVLFALFKLFPLKNKTVFLSSFGDNAFFIANELSKSQQHQMIFINQAKCKLDFTTIPTDNKKIYSFETSNILDTFYPSIIWPLQSMCLLTIMPVFFPSLNFDMK